MQLLVRMQYLVNKCYMAQVQSFNQSHFFKIKKKIEVSVLNFSFFTVNHCMYVCIGMEKGYEPKCTVAFSQERRVKSLIFFLVCNCRITI